MFWLSSSGSASCALQNVDGGGTIATISISAGVAAVQQASVPVAVGDTKTDGSVQCTLLSLSTFDIVN